MGRISCRIGPTQKARFMAETYTHTLYCDEAGNTGANYSDSEQPVMVLAGWLVPSAVESALGQAIAGCSTGQSPELHAKRILRSSSGWQRIIQLCALPLEHGATPFFYIVEKRYQLVERIVHALLDSHTNPRASAMPSLGHPGYNPLVDILFEAVPDGVLQTFARAIARPTPEAVGTSVRRIAMVLQPKHPSLAHVIAGCLQNLPDVVESDFAPRNGHQHHQLTSPHLPGFLHLLSAADAYSAEKALGEVGVVHDETQQYTAVWHDYFHHMRRAARDLSPWLTNPLLRRGFTNLSAIEAASSRTSRCIQVADILATALCQLVRSCCLGVPWSPAMQLIGRQALLPLVANDTTYGGISASLSLQTTLRRNLTR